MSYQLDYLSIIKAYFIPPDIVFLMTTIFILLITAGTGLYQFKKTNNRRSLGIMLGLGVLIPVIIILIGLIHTGSGWRLEGDNLVIHTRPGSCVIDISSAKVALVDTSGSWRPSIRTNGMSIRGFSTGKFILKNGKNAVVFRHKTSSKTLVLQANDRYYLLTHPGVEMLYQELVKREVKLNDL